MTIHTFHFYPSKLHLRAPAITLTPNHHTLIINAASPNPRNFPVPAVRATRNRLLPRSSTPPAVVSTATDLESAANVVRKFYDGINRQDLSSVGDLIAVNCVYEDLIFSRPFVGRKAIIDFFKQFIDSISIDLQFAIDDISEGDGSAVGVTWHLEWKGKPFPFSKGCSFYRLDVINGQRQIVYGRDCVEPATKPGDAALAVIRGVTWLLEKFPSLADRL